MEATERNVVLDELAKLLGLDDLGECGYDLSKEKDVVSLLKQIKIRALYNKFDLEATRRENSYLRKMLEEVD